MSLLNDALRAAENRQSRPAAPGAYVGDQQQSRNGRPVLLGILVALALLLAGLAGYWMLAGSASPAPVVTESEPSPDQQVQREAAVVSNEEPDNELVALEASAPQPQVAETEPAKPVDTEPEVTAPESTQAKVKEPEPAPEPSSRNVEPATEPESIAAEDGETDSGEASTAGVKQVPETPAATDRSTARALERLLARGNVTDAERQLAALAQEQAAPRSRYVVARALLVDGKQDQALNWLPENMAAQHPRLRLLRARAMHANNDLAGAVSTLASSVPPVEDHAEYRVTLATLLQQQGRNGDAARHWAELIAWDDSQGPWWVGLAISLEAQGESAGAARAYRQAAELPGLPRSLADYVQRRLQALRAG